MLSEQLICRVWKTRESASPATESLPWRLYPMTKKIGSMLDGGFQVKLLFDGREVLAVVCEGPIDCLDAAFTEFLDYENLWQFFPVRRLPGVARSS